MVSAFDSSVVDAVLRPLDNARVDLCAVKQIKTYFDQKRTLMDCAPEASVMDAMLRPPGPMTIPILATGTWQQHDQLSKRSGGKLDKAPAACLPMSPAPQTSGSTCSAPAQRPMMHARASACRPVHRCAPLEADAGGCRGRQQQSGGGANLGASDAGRVPRQGAAGWRRTAGHGGQNLPPRLARLHQRLLHDLQRDALHLQEMDARWLRVCSDVSQTRPMPLLYFVLVDSKASGVLVTRSAL